MKLVSYYTGLLLIGISSSCSTYQSGTRYESDDRYYSSRDAKKEQREARKLNDAAAASTFADVPNDDSNYNQADGSYQRITPPDQYSANDGSTVINNYYEMDDYYDYMYSSRIRRFHRNMGGLGYYNPYYTNMYYYNNNPYMWGTSIYSTYSFFNPNVPWGYPSWGGPGINFGWNSFSGFHFNMNLGYSNPYYMYNNPWRWNTWGYNPWSSPFNYNPWAYNPWGYYGMNSFNNGYMYGISNAMMYNSMMSNPSVYYNSYDNNSYNNSTNIVNNYGPNLTGSGGGSSYKASNLNNVFSQEIGQSATAVSANQGKNQTTTGGKGTTSIPSTSVSPVQNGSDKGATQVKPGTSVSNDKGGNSVTPIVNSGNQVVNSNPKGTSEIINQPKGNQSTVNSGGKIETAPSGKESLIQQGQVKPSNDLNSRPVQGNYTSAPVKGSQAVKDNSPAADRPANVSPSTYDVVKPSNANSSIQGAAANKPKEYTPNYDYNNGIRSNNLPVRGYSNAPGIEGSTTNQDKSNSNTGNGQSSGTNVNGNSGRPTTPSVIQESKGNSVNSNSSTGNPKESTRPNYQQYQSPSNYSSPRQDVQTPANNSSAPKQNNQVPANYSSPRQQGQVPSNNSVPRSNYQTPSNYSAPRQNNQAPSNYSAPKQNYQAPSNNSVPRQQYQAPTNNSAPRQQYQAPTNNSAPRQQYQAPARNSAPKQQYQAPARNNTPRQQAPSMNSAPKQSYSPSSAPKPSGGGRSSSGGGNSGSKSGGGKVSSPRK